MIADRLIAINEPKGVNKILCGGEIKNLLRLNAKNRLQSYRLQLLQSTLHWPHLSCGSNIR